MLAYADDLILVADSYEEQKKWLEILNNFFYATGLELNLKKSFHISSHDHNMVIPRAEKEFTILGFCFNSNGIVDRAGEIMERATSAAVKWTNISLNPLIKTQISKTYILSKTTYHSYLYDASRLVDSVENKMEKFLWNFKDRGRHKMRRERARIPLELGGLGVWCLSERLLAQKACLFNSLLFDQKKEIKIRDIWCSEVFKNGDKKQLLLSNSSTFKNNTLKILFDNWYKATTEYPILLESKSGKLKDWYNTISNRIDKIRTVRQNRIFKQYNVCLIEAFNRIKKVTAYEDLIFFFWHFVNGALLINRKKKCRFCNEMMINYNHIFFDCPSIIPITRKITDLVRLRGSLSISCWNEKNILNIFNSNKSNARVFTALGLMMIWNRYNNKKKPEFVIHELLVSDYFLFHRVDHPEINADKQHKKFVQRWGNDIFYKDGIPHPIYNNIGFYRFNRNG